MIEDAGDPTAENPPEQEEDMEEEYADAMPEISFHAIAGCNHPQTLRVIGTFKNKPITILIDSGSSHNFIDQNVVTWFGLSVERRKQLQFMVANTNHIKCLSQCKALTMNIQGCSIVVDYYILIMAACPLVLGVQWLATLGPV